jgi:hypothetical protein
MKKTSAKDFKQFVASFKKYQDLLGLHDFQVYFKHKSLERCFANCVVNCTDRCATVSFGTELEDEDFEDSDPVKSGKHEALHLLIHKLEWLADHRFVTQEQIDTEVEGLVNKLVDLIP